MLNTRILLKIVQNQSAKGHLIKKETVRLCRAQVRLGQVRLPPPLRKGDNSPNFSRPVVMISVERSSI